MKGNFFPPTTEDVWGRSSPTWILFQKAVGFSRLGCFTFILQSNEAPPHIARLRVELVSPLTDGEIGSCPTDLRLPAANFPPPLPLLRRPGPSRRRRRFKNDPSRVKCEQIIHAGICHQTAKLFFFLFFFPLLWHKKKIK